MSRPGLRYIMDASPFLCLIVCECGARLTGADRLEALHALASHEQRGHPGSKSGRDALWRATRRRSSLT